MDSITHIVIGACLGELIAGKQLGKKAMFIGALANSIPDVDVVAGLWNTASEQLLAHRGITHSFFFVSVFSPLLAYLFYKKNRSSELSYTRWLFLIGSGLLIHITMDAFTAYGTGWFEPFDHSRVSFNTIFILDPLFSLPILVGAIILVILNKKNPILRKRIAGISVLLTVLYLCLSIGIKLKVSSIVEKDLASKNISYESYMLTPTPMNNVLWYGIVRQKKDFYIGYYSLFDKNEQVFWELYAKNDTLLSPFKNKKDVSELIQFSKNYYCMSKQNNELTFSDMRFGQLGGWIYPQAEFVFRFNLLIENQSQLNLQQGRFKSFSSNEFNQFLKRIGGERP